MIFNPQYSTSPRAAAREGLVGKPHLKNAELKKEEGPGVMTLGWSWSEAPSLKWMSPCMLLHMHPISVAKSNGETHASGAMGVFFCEEKPLLQPWTTSKRKKETGYHRTAAIKMTKALSVPWSSHDSRILAPKPGLNTGMIEYLRLWNSQVVFGSCVNMCVIVAGLADYNIL